jgi:CRISPR/Cas system CMR-associated protein Cmr5 small subunit
MVPGTEPREASDRLFIFQNQFDAQEQEKAKRMTAIYRNQMANQLSDLQDQTAASERRKQEETAEKKRIEVEISTKSILNC